MEATIEMTNTVELNVLYQLFMSATHDASASMCRWTNGLITLTLDEVRELSLQEVSEELSLDDEIQTMVVLSLEGLLGGVMVLTFDEENGRSLTSALLKTKQQNNGHWNEMEQSALCETGNILGCAYANALNRMIGEELIPSVPTFLQDYAASVIQQALVMQAEQADRVVVCRTIFHREGERLDWRVFFIPSSELRSAMASAVQITV